MTRLERWLGSPRVIWIALVAAVLVGLPGLRVPPFADSFLASGVLQGLSAPVPPPSTRWSLYRYTPTDVAEMKLSITKGIYPWWTLPDLKLAFFRPLSSALRVLDYTLFGVDPFGAHVLSLLWYLGLVVVIAALLRRVLPGPIAAIALLIYAVSDSHVEPLASLMGRHVVVAGVFGFLGLLFHVRFREEGRPRWLAFSLLGLALGLAGGEAALSIFAYLIMYEVLAAPGAAGARLKALAPAAGLLLVWGLAYRALGYGCDGSGLFVSPVSDPLLWLRELPTRIPVLLGALLLHVPADLADGPTFVAVGLGGVVLVGALLWASWGSLTAEERRHARWLLAGALLSVPSVAVMPATNRVLLVPSLGAAVAAAIPLTRVLRAVDRRSWRFRVTALGAAALGFLHFVASPYILESSLGLAGQIGTRAEEVQGVLAEELDARRLPGQRVVVLASPNLLYGLYTSLQWWSSGRPLPEAWLTLSLAPEVHRVTRTGPATLEMELVEGRFFTSIGEQAHRSPRFPLPAGAKFQLDGLTAEVAEVDAQGVRKLRFVFDEALDDPSLVLLSWRDRAFRRWAPPPIGESVEINRVAVSK